MSWNTDVGIPERRNSTTKEQGIKCLVCPGEDTKLTFRVDIDETSKFNTFSENMDIKSSIIREMWLKEYNLIK